MKISHVKIKNYRSLKDFDLRMDDYTALIGANGSGKSSTLYGLRWFFTGKDLDISDIHGYKPDTESELQPSELKISVTVTFSDLTPVDRARLKEYGRGQNATFTRSWTAGDPKTKVVGNALAGPGFTKARLLSKVGELRSEYGQLRGACETLPDLGPSASKDAILQALAGWEDDPENLASLELVDEADANHMFGINGSNVIGDCVRLVLIPAATDISGHVGETNKGTALNDLIGSLMANAGAVARSAWLTKHEKQIQELNTTVRKSIEESTGLQAQRINSRLEALVPTATVHFKPNVPDWSPKGDASVMTSVTVDGLTNDVSRQGHGVQRAVMMAMFQSLVPDAELTVATHTAHDGESSEQTKQRLAEELEKLPFLVVVIEEPEIYQHPVRARSFARVLATLSAQQNIQIIIATHSPYFVRPEQFQSLRRLTLSKGVSEASDTNLNRLALASGCDEARAKKSIQLYLPTSFSEGFFADCVLLVEGETDKVILDSLGELIGTPFDSLGISVLDLGSKDALQVPYAMLAKELSVPTYVVFDGDALGAARKHTDQDKINNARASHKKSTDTICGWLPPATAVMGSLPYIFGGSTVVTDSYTIWEDDVEEELGKWPSFLARLQANGGELRQKNVLTYRAAILESDISDMPATLKSAMNAIREFRRDVV